MAIGHRMPAWSRARGTYNAAVASTEVFHYFRWPAFFLIYYTGTQTVLYILTTISGPFYKLMTHVH